jgi:hypothetical protein
MNSLRFAVRLISAAYVLTYVADMACHIAVVVHFIGEGDWHAAYAVLTNLVAAWIIFAAITTVRKPFPWLPRWATFMGAICVSPVVPLIAFVVAISRERRLHRLLHNFMLHRKLGTLISSNIPAAQKFRRRTLAVEVEDVEVSRVVTRHRDLFLYFYVESAVQAAPQIVIQLVIANRIGDMSAVHAASLLASLASVVTKVVVLCWSHDSRVLLYHFCLGAHDLFSCFFLYVTLSRAADIVPHAWAGSFLGWRVTMFQSVWLWGSTVVAALWLLTSLVGIVVLSRRSRSGGAMTLAGLPFCVVPAYIAMSSFRTFLWVVLMPRLRREVTVLSGAERSVSAPDPVGLFYPVIHAFVCSFRAGPARSLALHHVAEQYYRAASRELPSTVDPHTLTVSRLKRIAQTFKREVGASRIPPREASVEAAFRQWCEMVWMVMAMLQFYAVAYPVLAVSFHEYNRHDVLQMVSLCGAASALLVAGIIAPWAVASKQLDEAFEPFVTVGQIHDAQVLVRCCETYFDLPVEALLQDALSVRVLPREVTAVVGGYLRRSEELRHDVSEQACHALHTAIARREVVFEHAGINSAPVLQRASSAISAG